MQFSNSIDPNSTAFTTIRQTSFAGIISECPKMKKIFSLVEKVAKTSSTVLVMGPSGTGKELIARSLHKLSGRSGKLIPVNCGAIPEEILESELFGHEKGSFTGAINSRIGRFQMADNGTIFLDEIGEMSPKLQVKLLRVLQEKRVEPVGSTRFVDVDVRVIAATNKDLREEVKAGRFREDLYYRLQVVPIELPSLTARGSDVLILANYFLQRACANLGIDKLALTEAVEQKFMSYNWPGNVRELENLIERLSIMANGHKLELNELPEYMHESQGGCSIFEVSEEMPEQGLDFNQLVENLETKLITMALNKTSGNKKAAAKLLRLNRTTLVEKIRKKGLDSKVEMIVEQDDALQETVAADAAPNQALTTSH
jgi:transcriptional regulator with GAF, ATPase, and Fis domain